MTTVGVFDAYIRPTWETIEIHNELHEYRFLKEQNSEDFCSSVILPVNHDYDMIFLDPIVFHVRILM